MSILLPMSFFSWLLYILELTTMVISKVVIVIKFMRWSDWISIATLLWKKWCFYFTHYTDMKRSGLQYLMRSRDWDSRWCSRLGFEPATSQPSIAHLIPYTTWKPPLQNLPTHAQDLKPTHRKVRNWWKDSFDTSSCSMAEWRSGRIWSFVPVPTH